MMSGGCGALRMTMAFSLESLSAGNPCDFHLVGVRVRVTVRVTVRVRLGLRLGLGLGLGIGLTLRLPPEQLALRREKAQEGEGGLARGIAARAAAEHAW